MANINQPSPGTPDKDSNDPYIVAEDHDTSTGVHIRRQLWSDGSRKVWRNGELEEHKVLSDREKAAGPTADSVQEAQEKDLPLTGPQAEQLNAVAAAHGISTDEALARQEGKVLDSSGNEVTPEEAAPASPEIAAQVVTAHGASESGDLNELAGAGQPVGEDNKVEPPQGWDEPVLGESWEQPATEAQLAGVPKYSEQDGNDAADQAANMGPKQDGPAPEEHNEARDNLEALNDEADDPLAKPDDGLINSENDPQVDDGLDFKTIPELREQAKEENINLHGATTKQDILDNIRKGDKNDA